MISFLNPLYLLLLPLAALPILLNLVKRRVRLRIRFPSVQLLKLVEERRARRRPKWQEILLLALRVAAVALLVVTLAGPRLAPGGASPPRAVVAVVDNSPSMAYVEDGEARLARAVRYVRALGAGANAGDVGAVVWTGARENAPAWEDLAGVAGGASAEPAAEGRLADALAAAGELFAEPEGRGRRREVAVFTDLQQAAFEGLAPGVARLPADVRTTFYDVRIRPGPAWNVAVTAFRVLPAAAGLYDVILDVRQYGRTRPLTVAATDGRAAEVPASSRSKARFSVPGGRRYDFSCLGGYAFDDRVSAFLPAADAVPYAVAPGTPGGALWEAAFAAVGMVGRGADEGDPPGVYVLPVSDWRSSRRGLARAERGCVVVVVPDDAGGGRLDDGTVVKEFAASPGAVAADPSVLANAARAGRFRTGGHMEVASSAPWAAAAATADGSPFILTRPAGKGVIFLTCAPVGREYSDFFTSVAFLGFVQDLNLKALAAVNAEFAAARAFDTSESDPSALGEDAVRRLFPHAVVTRNAPSGRRGRSVPLASHAAAAVFILLAAEALLASYRAPYKA